MKRTLFHLITAILTFLLGLFAVSVALELSIAGIRNEFLSVSKDQIKEARIVSIALRLPRFTETFRACRPGHIQGYISNDGIKATEASCDDNDDRKPANVIERRTNRAVLEFIDDGEARYEIRKYDRGQCFSVIKAPSLAIALELDDFL